eukprot:79391_1
MYSEVNTNDPAPYDKLVLFPKQLVQYQVKDEIDHRDDNGRFMASRIVEKRNGKFKLKHYEFRTPNTSWCDYNINACLFAEHKSISFRKASRLKDLKEGDTVEIYPYPTPGNGKWRKGTILQLDSDSGQVRVKYSCNYVSSKTWWVHLDNTHEIRRYKSENEESESQKKGYSFFPWNNSTQVNDNNMNRLNHINQHQIQVQVEEKLNKMDEIVVRTQLLLDVTSDQLFMINEYLSQLCEYNKINVKSEKVEEMISLKNQKVITGLTLFRMKISGMRKNEKKQQFDFSDAFNAATVTINKFKKEMIGKFGEDKIVCSRLGPLLNYMYAVLQKQSNIPTLPYLSDYKFNKSIATNTLSSVVHSMNHVIPNRIKDVKSNSNEYRDLQNKLTNEYDVKEHVTDIKIHNLTQDLKGQITFPLTKQQQKEMNKQMHHDYAFQPPNLDDDSDEEESSCGLKAGDVINSMNVDANDDGQSMNVD